MKRNILTKGCILYSEVEFLLHQELRETPIYNSIIEAVAVGNTKLNDISQKSLVENTSANAVLPIVQARQPGAELWPSYN